MPPLRDPSGRMWKSCRGASSGLCIEKTVIEPRRGIRCPEGADRSKQMHLAPALLPVRAESKRQPDNSAAAATTLAPKAILDARLPAIGTILQRDYQGVIHEVKVLGQGFRFRGRVYPSPKSVLSPSGGSEELHNDVFEPFHPTILDRFCPYGHEPALDRSPSLARSFLDSELTVFSPWFHSS